MNTPEPSCPICTSDDVSFFFETEAMPAHVGIQWPTRAEAMACPRGDLRLQFCHTCGYIHNVAFDPSVMEYSEAYDNSLHYSPRFQAYTDAVVRRLVDRYDLHEKTIVELGCGKGDFLMALCAAGDNRGIGFDPSYEDRPLPDDLAPRLTFIRDFYTEASAHYDADFICSRYVFEHVPHPIAFLQMVRRSIGGRAGVVVYFEVPNVDLILKDLSIWDVIYEHVSYFSPSSLAEAFSRSGFAVKDVVNGYEGQFIGIEAVANAANEPHRWNDVDRLALQVGAYEQNVREGIAQWNERLRVLDDAGKTCVAWGAGAKAVSFLNMLERGRHVRALVDINPNKHGRFMPGTGQLIVAPEQLPALQPDVVIVMNPIYRDEIRAQVAALGLEADFLYAS